MRDTLETELAARLRDVAASVPDELAPPADLEERVARRRRRATHVPRLATLGIAAAIVGAVAIVSVVARAPDEGTIVSTSARGSAAVARLDNTAIQQFDAHVDG